MTAFICRRTMMWEMQFTMSQLRIYPVEDGPTSKCIYACISSYSSLYVGYVLQYTHTCTCLFYSMCFVFPLNDVVVDISRILKYQRGHATSLLRLTWKREDIHQTQPPFTTHPLHLLLYGREMRVSHSRIHWTVEFHCGQRAIPKGGREYFEMALQFTF